MTKKTKLKDKNVPKQKPLPRNHRISIALNDAEMRAFNRYVKEMKIGNKSDFVRRTIMITIFKKFEDDAPTLFDDVE